MIEVYNILRELNSDNSTNYKLEVLEKYKDNEKLKKYLLYVYNPSWNYYLTLLPKIENSKIRVKLVESNFYSILDKLKGRKITGNLAIDSFKEHLESCDEVGYELYKHIIERDIRCNIGVKSINKVISNLISDIFYLRCSKLDEKALERFDSMPDGFLAQLKADGIFSYIIIQDGEVSFLTRAGTQWTSDKLSKELKHLPNCVVVGEALIIEDGKVFDRKTGNGLITKFIKRESTLETLEDKAKSGRTKAKLDLAEKRDEFNWIDSTINFQVWDSLTLEEFENGLSTRPYTERFGEAIRLSFMTQSLQPIPSYRVYSMKEAQAIADEYISEGFEGAVVKKLDTIWEDGTSKDMVKIKEVYDADLYCVGIKEGKGKGKYKGKIGSLILQTSCGRIEVDCGSGLTDPDRNKRPDEFIGKIIEIQYNKFIQSKKDKPASLYLPRFVEVREDKNTATSYEEIIG